MSDLGLRVAIVLIGAKLLMLLVMVIANFIYNQVRNTKLWENAFIRYLFFGRDYWK